MRWVAMTLAAVLAWGVAASRAGEIYKWTDEHGVLHIVTSLADVPEQYRDQVAKMETLAEQPSPGGAAAGEDPPQEADLAELTRFEVPYRNEGATRRVIISVTFNDRVTAPMALDTGSPGLLISFDLAERLGIFSRDSGALITEAGGIGGSTPAIKTIMDSVSVEQARDTFVPTTVMAQLSREFEGLVGMDFLANYTISIDTRKQVVVFEERTPDPQSRGGHDEQWWRSTFAEFRQARDRWREQLESGRLGSGERIKAFVEFQAREAERLYNRLDLYASDHAVPRHWR